MLYEVITFSSYYVHTPVIPNNSWLIEKYKKQLPDASENEIKYAVFVETMDYYYGQLLSSLEKFGLKENTLVLFTSDNGGHPAYIEAFIPTQQHSARRCQSGYSFNPLFIERNNFV